MRKVTGYLLWLYVFTVPWDVVALPGLGTSTRAAGLLVIGAAVLTVVAEGRLRRPDLIFGLAIAFTGLSALSLLWTISYSSTLEAVWTYAQLLGSLWVAREVARTKEQHQWLLFAFCLGGFIPMASLLYNFLTGVRINAMPGRYTADGFNADGVGLLMAITIPIAWHVMLTQTRMVRVVGIIFFAIAPIVLLLTGTRGAFLSGLAGFSIVPLSLARRGLRTFLLVTVLLILVAASITSIVPQSIWERLATIPSELAGGSMSTRKDIWQAGLDVFPDRPLLGLGAGAYGAMLSSRDQRALPAHNVMLGLLVEEGIVGVLLFIGLLGGCALMIFRMHPADRRLWTAVMLSWAVGMMSLSSERWKVTWVLFGLLSAQSGLALPGRSVRRSHRERAEPAVRTGGQVSAYPPGPARISVSR